MTVPFEVLFLRDDQHGGGPDQLRLVSDAFAAFVAAATTSIDMAIYDMRLADATASTTVVSALTAAADRGVVVRLAYDAGTTVAALQADAQHGDGVPAPGDAADVATQVTLAFAAVGADPAPPGTTDWIETHFAGTGVQTRAIQAGHQLMHSKFVVRDAPGETASPTTPVGAAAVWTGSTNFTDDAWTRQENNILTLTDDAVAVGYRADFDQMWTSSSIDGAGADGAGSAVVAGARVEWDFCPGDGSAINSALAARIAAATRRLIVGSMVLTSHEVLAALADAIRRGIEVSGIYDAGQMGPIADQWKSSPHQVQTLAHWTDVAAVLVGKHSTPYTPTGPHDFMHLKVLVADDTVTTGSYNFSANAEHNAENQLHLDDQTTVDAYADYLVTISAAYR